MSDRDTTAFDGAPCALCGDDAADVFSVEDTPQMPLCESCALEQITDCPQCDTTVRCAHAVRVGSALWCRGCAEQDAAITRDYMAAQKSDEQRDDDFNRARR